MGSINWLDRDIANGSSKNSVSKKYIKCNNTIKQCKKWLNLMYWLI